MRATNRHVPYAGTFLCLLQLLSAPVQASGLKGAGTDSCLAQATACSQALVAGDYQKVVACTYSKVVQMVGGSKTMIDMMRSGREKMKSDGFDFQAVKVEQPTAIASSAVDQFAVVKTQLTMKAPQGTLLQNSFMLAVSSDKGQSWKFVDGAGLDDKKVKILFPNLPAAVTLPAKEEPNFVPAASP